MREENERELKLRDYCQIYFVASPDPTTPANFRIEARLPDGRVLGQVSERKPADPLNYGAALLLPLGLLGDAVNLVTLPLGFSLI